MNEDRLRDALRAAPVDDAGARARSLEVVRGAYREQGPPPRRPRRLPLARALAGLLLLAAAGAYAGSPRTAVGDWVRQLVGARTTHPHPGLTRVPGGGRLLVVAGHGTWVVSADGSQRRLGAYSGASWSPHGLFVVVWSGHQLSAVDPLGRVHWSIARTGTVEAARWSPVDGFRIAYVTGHVLRIVNGDGTGDHRYGSARSHVAPAWRPDGMHVLAYVDKEHVRVASIDAHRKLWRSPRLAGIRELVWSSRGRDLLVLTARRLLLYDGSGRLLAVRHLRAGFEAEAASFSPTEVREAAVLTYSSAAQRSEVTLLDPTRAAPGRPVFTGPGRFGGIAWSPKGDRLLVPWPDADQWLFLSVRGREHAEAAANIAKQFSPGAGRPSFPRSVEWCCPRP